MSRAQSSASVKVPRPGESPQPLYRYTGNRLEALRGDQAGRQSIRVNDRYRITFRFEDGGAWEVRCEDYH